MKFDIFFSICQTPVNGFVPDEREMFQNFFDQVIHADQLGFKTAWVAETHLSCQVQKENPGGVIPHFQGEIGLNTDILQLAHLIFAKTKKIEVGSAIRNILCNGGPIAHAEAVKTFLSLHGLDPNEKRKLHLGFASGRFPFSNTPYGIKPQTPLENLVWPILKGKIFHQATELFLRLLNGEILSTHSLKPLRVENSDFRTESHLEEFIQKANSDCFPSEFPSRWQFEKIGVIPFHPRLDLLELVIGSHDPESQILANKYRPCGVFNLSITPGKEIEATHQRMLKNYHPDGGDWDRSKMPRTVLIFIDKDKNRAEKRARAALETYWKAMEGTLDPQRVENAVENALWGRAEDIVQAINNKYHPSDRLMLWFDFFNHDNQEVKNSMSQFMNEVVPALETKGS